MIIRFRNSISFKKDLFAKITYEDSRFLGNTFLKQDTNYCLYQAIQRPALSFQPLLLKIIDTDL